MTAKVGTRKIPAELQCAGKRAFATIVEATRAAQMLRHRKSRGYARSYWCPHCGAYHFGRATGEKKRIIMAYR